MNSNLSRAVHDLLARRIDSFEKLELVLAIHRAPRQLLSVDELCRVLTFPRETVRRVVTELRVSAVVSLTSRGEVQLRALTRTDQAAVDELVAQYHDDRLPVLKALGELAIERVRGFASRAFTEAFLGWREPRDDQGDP